MKNIFFILFSFIILFSNQLNNKSINEIENKDNFSFIVLGDSRNAEIIKENVFGYGDSVFAEIVKSINNLSNKPDFILHTGDLTKIGLKKEYKKYLDIIDSLNIPIITMQGNHELYSDSANFDFNQYFGSGEFTFEIGNYIFIGINTCHAKKIKNKNYCDYFISLETLLHLDSVFAYAQKNKKIPFIFSHTPPIIDSLGYSHHCLGSEEYYPKPNYEKSNVELFMNLLEYYNVPLAVFGHIHHYDNFNYHNTYFVISGGAGAPLRKSYERGDTINHFILFNVYSNDSLIANVLDKNGKTIDAKYNFTLRFNNYNNIKDKVYTELRNDTLYFNFDKKLIRHIKIKNFFSKTIYETIIFDKEIAIPIGKFVIRKYTIQTGNNTIKGKVFNLF